VYVKILRCVREMILIKEQCQEIFGLFISHNDLRTEDVSNIDSILSIYSAETS
jgi:hypothetical protein